MSATALGLVLSATGVAAARTVGNARRLGSEIDTPAEQSRLARLIFRDHVFCLTAIAMTLTLELAAGR